MSALAEHRVLLSEAAEKLFGALAGAASFDAELWQEVEGAGMTSVLVPEEEGGFGGGWEDAFAVLHAAALHAVPLPLMETLLARSLLSEARISAPAGPIALACVENARLAGHDRGAGRLYGRAASVPWAGAVEHVVATHALDDVHCVALLAASTVRMTGSKSNIAGEPRADIELEGAQVLARGEVRRDAFLFGALARSAQMAGALSWILERSVQHANERRQFGKPIGRFQAIQHALASLANETAAVNCSALAACRAADRGDAAFEIAVTKLRANRAADAAASITHQVHGAIGFTEEHQLHRATQRLWSWRCEYGNERLWAARLGDTVARRGAHGLWAYITALGDSA